MIKIIAVHFENGKEHQHISKFNWMNTNTNKSGTSSLKEMIEYINNHAKTVFVEDKQGLVEVFVIDHKPPYLRTKKDNRETDNLLYLSTF